MKLISYKKIGLIVNTIPIKREKPTEIKFLLSKKKFIKNKHIPDNMLPNMMDKIKVV